MALRNKVGAAQVAVMGRPGQRGRHRKGLKNVEGLNACFQAQMAKLSNLKLHGVPCGITYLSFRDIRHILRSSIFNSPPALCPTKTSERTHCQTQVGCQFIDLADQRIT